MKAALPLVFASLPLHAATLSGLWEFNNPANLGVATIGSDLTVNGPASATGGSADLPKGSWLSVPNPVGANGPSGTPSRTNQYSIVLDFQIPDFTDGGTDDGTFTSLFDFDNGGSDADFFIRKQVLAEELGLSGQWPYVGSGPGSNGDGTSGTILTNTWYRLVLTADVGVGRAVYLNGSLVGNFTVGSQDSVRQSLSTASPWRVLWDNDGETSGALISNLAIFDGRLNGTEVASLGGAGSPIPEPSSLGLAGLGALLSLRRRRQAAARGN